MLMVEKRLWGKAIEGRLVARWRCVEAAGRRLVEVLAIKWVA